MKISELMEIEDQYSNNKRHLMEMVVKRLVVTDPEHPMTWPYICECLRRPTVERNDVAEEIEGNVPLYLCSSNSIHFGLTQNYIMSGNVPFECLYALCMSVCRICRRCELGGSF